MEKETTRQEVQELVKKIQNYLAHIIMHYKTQRNLVVICLKQTNLIMMFLIILEKIQ